MGSMERYSLIVVADETAPIRRFDIRKDVVRRAGQAAVAAVCLLLIGTVDYVRVRIDHPELQTLRVEAGEQQRRIEEFEAAMAQVDQKLQRLREFERKVRIIANLPGAAATGGEDVTAVGAATGGDIDAAAAGETPVPTRDGAEAAPEAVPPAPQARAADEASGDRLGALREDAERFGMVADARELSISDLLERLEEKRHHLASTPAVWPAKGWLTSRFGNRVSPFTGGRQFHAGIDIAGARGTDVIAPARGKVRFAGKKGHLGRSVIVDHGYGIRTIYGHNDEIFVKHGQEVERGQVIASLGSTGRSTGPHLHYVVEVNGKAVDPLDYIFD
jgi:murein DD-endopeptidase MepM/ murein hydrolase activator NlpD